MTLSVPVLKIAGKTVKLSFLTTSQLLMNFLKIGWKFEEVSATNLRSTFWGRGVFCQLFRGFCYVVLFNRNILHP